MENKQPKNNKIEQATFYLGLVILISLVGYLIFQYTSKQDTPPSLKITTQYEAKMDDYAYKVKVENNGHETAQTANLKFDLYQDGKVAKTAVLTIGYIPVNSTETGWVVFPIDRKPTDSLVINSITYVKP